jgi:high-affinity iron transporter
MFFAAGLLADAVQNMQGLGWLRFLASPLWHTGGLLSEGSTIGDIAHSFVGYADSPTPLQVLAYAVYLVTVLAFFLRVGNRGRSSAAPAVTSPAS